MQELNWETQKQINEVTLAALHKIEEAFIVLGGMVEELNNQIRELDNQIGKNSK